MYAIAFEKNPCYYDFSFVHQLFVTLLLLSIIYIFFVVVGIQINGHSLHSVYIYVIILIEYLLFFFTKPKGVNCQPPCCDI